MGMVEFEEPFLRLFNQGVILGQDHEKMSKSRGNVVNPDDVVGVMGADAVRCFLMFIGPWDHGGPWSGEGINGLARWLNRVWDIANRDAAAPGRFGLARPRAIPGGCCTRPCASATATSTGSSSTPLSRR